MTEVISESNRFLGSINDVHLRFRLIRRVVYRLWKSTFLSCARLLIGEVEVASADSLTSVAPAIILSSFTRISDFLILSYLFIDKQLTFISPRVLPDQPMINWLRSTNRLLYLSEGRIGYRFFKNLLSTLRDFNRSVVISPEAAKTYADKILVDPAVIVRIAMKANVPIIPVVLDWRRAIGNSKGIIKKCDVWVGKKIFISPRSDEFRDIFFRRKGARKFRNLPDVDLTEIGKRIFDRLTVKPHGTNLSKQMGARIF